MTSAELSDAIANATRTAVRSLFREHPGRYYYCSLITTGEAHPPVLAAWSREALAAAAAGCENPEEARRMLKWSYADSPFYCYGEEYFDQVQRLFAARPQLTPALNNEQWESEYQFRLQAMESAVGRLDSEGTFGTGLERLGIVVLVEVMPPDHTNTERALRLNPREALTEWLNDAAEKQD